MVSMNKMPGRFSYNVTIKLHKPRGQSINDKGKFKIHQRMAKLINANNGRLVKFSDMPVEGQLALVQYMAIDGEAWILAPDLEDNMDKHIKLLRGETHSDAAMKAWNKTLLKFLPWYVKNYGHEEYGYVDKMPIKALIESCMQDDELKQDYPSLNGWNEYHKWYMGNPKHGAVAKNPWPVILSGFDDETLQDGWTRFHQYAEKHLESCPAIFYTRKTKKEELAQDKHREKIATLYQN